MTYSPNTPAKASMLVGLTDRLRRAEGWLDSKGRGAWIAATGLGLVFVWPVGLALFAYVILANKWRKTMFLEKFGSRSATRSGMGRSGWGSSGNSAFDAYKADTLRRLEEEQHAFESFLDRLRDAKDKQEFDSFMQDRAKGTARPVTEGDVVRSDA
jgi:hypothetical protein